jgi:hypothetical protein
VGSHNITRMLKMAIEHSAVACLKVLFKRYQVLTQQAADSTHELDVDWVELII